MTWSLLTAHRFGGSDPSSASLQALEASNQAKDVSSKSGGLQISDNGVSRDARVAMRKKFILEKKKKGSQKKVDLHRVHDPIGTSIFLFNNELVARIFLSLG